MVYNSGTPETTNNDESIPYDLRQIYAVTLVGEHLQDVARARKANDYQNYFRSLKDLWIITQHKAKAKGKNAKDPHEEYSRLLRTAVEIINSNIQCFNKKSQDPRGIAKIEMALNNIEMFLYNMMNEAGLFGTKWEDEGL